MLKSYQQLNNYSDAEAEALTKAVVTIESITRNALSVLQPCPYLPAGESSVQPLPLASEEGRSRPSAMWFEVPRSLMGCTSACGGLLAWHCTRDSQTVKDLMIYGSHWSFAMKASRLACN